MSRLDSGHPFGMGSSPPRKLGARTHGQSRARRALRDSKPSPVIVWLVVTETQEWREVAKVTEGMAEPGPK